MQIKIYVINYLTKTYLRQIIANSTILKLYDIQYFI